MRAPFLFDVFTDKNVVRWRVLVGGKDHTEIFATKRDENPFEVSFITPTQILTISKIL